MSLLIVCPVIRPPEPHIIESWNHRPHLCVINGEHESWERTCADHGLRAHVSVDAEGQPYNAGCASAWNRGFGVARAESIDYVAIMSQSLWLSHGTERLAERVEAQADDRGLTTDWAFHCIVFSVALWERVGGFDEDLPIACDMDFVGRLLLAGERTLERPMRRTRLGTAFSRRAAALEDGAVPADTYAVDIGRFRAKWGGEGVWVPLKEALSHMESLERSSLTRCAALGPTKGLG